VVKGCARVDDFERYLWGQFFWYFGTLAPIVFLASLYYSHSLLLGIACARDEQHRMTSLSPWNFFMRKFKWRGIGIGVGLAPWVMFGTFLARYVNHRTYWRFHMSFQNALGDYELTDLVMVVGIIYFSFAAITVLAPRFRSPIPSAASGTVIVILYMNGVIELVEQTSVPQTNSTALILFTFPGLAMVVLSWLYVRFVLNRAWFRFES